MHQGDEAGDDSDDDGTNDGNQIRGMVRIMNLAEMLRQEAVAGNCKEDTGLAKEVHDQGRNDTGQDADSDEVGKIRPAEETQCIGNRFRCIELGVVNRCSQRQGNGDVQGHTNGDRRNDPNRKVTGRILTFFSRSSNGVEAHVREENNRCAAEDAADAERCERVKVIGIGMGSRRYDEGYDGCQCDEDECKV